MNMNTTLIFSLASVLGMAIKLKQKNDSLIDLAQKGNFTKWTAWEFLWDNRKSIFWASVGVALFQLVFGNISKNIINNASDVAEPFLWGWANVSRKEVTIGFITALYTTVSYMGQDFVFASLSKTSQWVRKGIDWKTTEGDKATGNLDTPTPIKP